LASVFPLGQAREAVAELNKVKERPSVVRAEPRGMGRGAASRGVLFIYHSRP